MVGITAHSKCCGWTVSTKLTRRSAQYSDVRRWGLVGGVGQHAWAPPPCHSCHTKGSWGWGSLYSAPLPVEDTVLILS